MIFITEHVKIERYADCWSVATKASFDAKGKMREVAQSKWNAPNWYYATLQAAAHKALEIESRESDDVTELCNAVKEIDAAYSRIYKSIDDLTATAREVGLI